MDKNPNMDLWSSVHDTPPQYTKAFRRSGGFAGTAIDPTYLVMRATELWGPLGMDWGYEIVDEQYINGEPIFAPREDGIPPVVIGNVIIHKIRLRLTYPGKDAVGHIEQFGQTTFVGRDKNGLFTDEEHAKKSLTDALSKCLSLLGFGADVRIGSFEDSSYVAAVESSAAQEQTRTSGIDDAKKTEIIELLDKMGRTWENLAPICASTFKRQVSSLDQLTADEAVKVVAFLKSKVEQ